MSRFLLVHGAWLGAWCWESVAKQLQASGHEVLVPDLPGHGRDQTPLSAISLQSYVDAVSSSMRGEKQAVIVGHSMAGIVLSSLAEQMPDAISSLIYVAAYLLQSAESIVDASAIATGSLVGPNMVPARDWSTISIRPEAMQEVFAADAPPHEIERLRSLTRPEPAAPFNTPIQVTSTRFGRVKRSYIKTSQDRAVTPQLQDSMLAKTPCGEVLTMHTSHTPFFAASAELAAALVHLSAEEKGAGA
jgi:pimeloyl-ACP methyl ester carboxylesterase